MTAVAILISSVLPARFRGLFKNITADSPVQKAFMASCFEVTETQLRGETRPSLSPLLHALHSFFYKNIFYKNIEAEICEILRIFLE